MPAVLRHLPRTLSLAVMLLAAGCSDGPTTAPSASGTINLSIVSGNTQSGVVGQELPSALVVKATKPNGGPISDLIVVFRVSGGGSTYVAATATNSHGEAWNYWTLGTSTAEPQRVEVRAVLSDGTKQLLGVFTATPLVGPAVLIVPHDGDGDTVFTGKSVPVAPSVLVTDQYDNPVPNLPVTFSVASGGGSVTGASPLTDSAGIATVGGERHLWKSGDIFRYGFGLDCQSADADAALFVWSGRGQWRPVRRGRVQLLPQARDRRGLRPGHQPLEH
jgi:hypothetical protein